MSERIRRCRAAEQPRVLEIINDGAEAYCGVIPAECWHEPYMSDAELGAEIRHGVTFWGFEQDNELLGVMGLQDRDEVKLVRHAYVLTLHRRRGIGGRLLRFVETLSDKPMLIGTWAAATWAIEFYKQHGYQLTTGQMKTALLQRYWTVPAQQIRASVVLKKGDLPGL